MIIFFTRDHPLTGTTVRIRAVSRVHLYVRYL